MFLWFGDGLRRKDVDVECMEHGDVVRVQGKAGPARGRVSRGRKKYFGVLGSFKMFLLLSYSIFFFLLSVFSFFFFQI